MAARNPMRGALLLAQALVAAGHSREDACARIPISAGGLSHILLGTRGVGLDVGTKVEVAYPSVSVAAWKVPATPAEIGLLRETVEKISKRRRAVSARPSEAPCNP